MTGRRADDLEPATTLTPQASERQQVGPVGAMTSRVN